MAYNAKRKCLRSTIDKPLDNRASWEYERYKKKILFITRSDESLGNAYKYVKPYFSEDFNLFAYKNGTLLYK